MKDHLNNQDIHLNILDRDFLDTFNEETEELLQLIKDHHESEWIVLNGCNHKKCTCENQNYCTCLEYLVAIPEGKVILTKSVRLKDYKGIWRTIDAPAYIIHTKESIKIKCDTCKCDEDKCNCDCSKVQIDHQFTIISSNDVILYDETIDPDENKSGLWISLRNVPTPEDLDKVVDQFNSQIKELTDSVNDQFEETRQSISSLNGSLDDAVTDLNSKIGDLTTHIGEVETSTKNYVDTAVGESIQHSNENLQTAKEYADNLTKNLNDKVDDNKTDTDSQVRELESTINTKTEELSSKIADTEAALSQEIKDAENRSSEYINSEITRLNGKVDDNKLDSDSKVEELSNKITDFKTELSQEIVKVKSDSENYTDNQVSDVENRLNDKINDNQTNTSNEIESLRQRDLELDSALDTLKADTESGLSNLDSKIDSSTSQLSEKIDDTKNEINQTITDTTNSLSKDIQDLRSDAEQADKDLDSKIETKDSEMKTYVDQLLSTNDAMIFKGTIGKDGTVTDLPLVHDIGWTYKVVTPGEYASQQFEVGDLIVSMTKVAPETKDLIFSSRVQGPDTEDFFAMYLHGDTLDNESYLLSDSGIMTLRLSASLENYHYGNDDQYRILIGRPTLIDNEGITLNSNDYDTTQGPGEKGDALYGDGQSANKNYILGFASESGQGTGKVQLSITFQHREYKFPSTQWVPKSEGTLTFNISAKKLVHDSNEWTGVQVNEDGLVTGPVSSVNEGIPVFDGITGKIIKDSGVTVQDIDKEITDIRNDLNTHIGQSDTQFTEVDQKIEDSKLRWENLLPPLIYNFDKSFRNYRYNKLILQTASGSEINILDHLEEDLIVPRSDSNKIIVNIGASMELSFNYKVDKKSSAGYFNVRETSYDQTFDSKLFFNADDKVNFSCVIKIN